MLHFGARAVPGFSSYREVECEGVAGITALRASDIVVQSSRDRYRSYIKVAMVFERRMKSQ
jgi:hypothetical protein